MKLIVYVVMIITGLLIVKFGLGHGHRYDKIFGWIMVGFGAINIIWKIIKRRKKRLKTA
jgi:hypothetical protein